MYIFGGAYPGRKFSFLVIVIILPLCPLLSAQAAWISHSSKVNSVSAYTTGNNIFAFNMTTNPAGKPTDCSATNSFGVDPSVPDGQRNQIVSLVLFAKANNLTVTITYDDTSCVLYSGTPTFMKIYRVTIQ